jgi:hypothetical protein
MSTQNANNVAITGGTITGTPISGSTVGGSTITAATQFSGPGTGLTGTASGLSIGGNAATATSATTAGSATTATTATNLAGGAAGSLPYQSAAATTAMLGIGSTGQVLTVTADLPAWSSVSGFAVTSFSAGTTGFTPSSSTNGAITLAGTLNTGNGGTGLTTFTSGGAVYATSTSALTTGTLPVASGGTGVTISTGTGNETVVMRYSEQSRDWRLTRQLTISDIFLMGKWTVEITASDKFGNSGVGYGSFDVSPLWFTVSVLAASILIVVMVKWVSEEKALSRTIRRKSASKEAKSTS